MTQAAVPAGQPATSDRGSELAIPPSPRRGGIPDRWWFLLVWVVALLVFLSYDRGQIAFDTKLGVDLDPTEFLSRLWPLWNPLEWFGSLQNQYIGYAIPMAPFFAVGQLVHVPVWVTERLWVSLLVTAAFAGLVRLAAALRIGSSGSRLLAGAAFALWPTFTIAMGTTSAATLPGIMMPWAVLPLVPALRGGSGIWRAAARSGVAIALMGGVNATSTLAVLVFPALYIVAGSEPRRAGTRLRARLTIAWLTAVVAATAWWLVPLLLQGNYSFNFLPYIEQSVTTARTMSADAVLRGSGTWTAYLDLGGSPWIRAGWVMVTTPVPILASAIVAAAGLAALARRDMPERTWLAVSASAVVLVAMSTYYGPLSGPLSSLDGRLYDGALAPLRSTYKYEPVLAAVLALACAHAMGRLRGRFRTPAPAAAGAALVTVVLCGLALPQLTGQMSSGTFSRIPAYWYQAADYLAAHSARQTALVVPADPHGQFLWGSTSDDPLEVLASSPWTERGIVPYGGAGSQQLLETAETALESGQDVPGLARYLARAGIRYVVVRNDISLGMIGYIPPQDANETLAQSGFERVAAFGPLVESVPDYPQVAGGIPGYAQWYPAVEIFQTTNPSLRPSGPVTSLAASQTTVVNGGVDSLLQLGAQGVLTTNTPASLSGDTLPDKPATWAVTDGQRRADNLFGNTSDYVSYTYTATGTNPVDSPLGGGGQAPRQLLPVAAAAHQTVAVLTGAASVTASSAGTWLGESQQSDPVNAFDGDDGTAWTEADPTTPVDQWIQIDFDHSLDLPSRVRIRLLDDSPYRALASELTVTTAAGSARTVMAATGGEQPLNVRPGATSWLRITISAAVNSTPGGPGAGISDVLIPGVKVTKYLQPAEDPAGATASKAVYSFVRQPEESQLARTFTTADYAAFSTDMTASPVAGTALNKLITSRTAFPEGAYQVTASSTWSGLPEFGADNVVKGSVPWIAASTDQDPTITVRWHGTRTIRSFTLTSAQGLTATPDSVVVRSSSGAQTALVSASGLVTLPHLVHTDMLSLSFPSSTHAATLGAAGQPGELPVGLSRLVIPGLRGLRLSAPVSQETFHLSCGSGPRVTIDGRTYQTSVAGTVGDLLALRPVGLRLCSAGGYADLSAGRHWLTAGQSAMFELTSLTMRSASAAASPAPPQRQVRVLSWGSDARTVSIGAGSTSYLEVHENYNSGWIATLNGHRLTPVILDGWQQAFIVPAGSGGVIDLAYQAATAYHVGLVVSAMVLLGLIGVAFGRRRRDLLLPRTLVASLDAAPIAGSAGRRGRIPLISLAALTLVILAAGGWAAIAVPVLAIAAAWRPRWMTWIAGLAMFGAGITAATAADPAALGSGAFSGLAQGLALIALAAALMPYPKRAEVVPDRYAIQRGGRAQLLLRRAKRA